jgi:hypothetical protein
MTKAVRSINAIEVSIKCRIGAERRGRPKRVDSAVHGRSPAKQLISKFIETCR